MKKIVVAVCMSVLLGSTFAVAAPGFAGQKITNSKIVQARKDTTVDFAGSKIFVPQGQTVIIGQLSDGSIVIRGLNLNNVQINNSRLSTQGFSIVSYQPTSNVAFLNKGESMTVTDPAGVTATVAENGAISTVDATVTSETVPELKAQAQAQVAAVAEALEEGEALPAFVAATETSSAASE